MFSSPVIAGLVTYSMLTRCPAGKRLAPTMAVVLPLYRRDGALLLADDEAALLISMNSLGPLSRNSCLRTPTR
jgi:hypothetical protein